MHTAASSIAEQNTVDNCQLIRHILHGGSSVAHLFFFSAFAVVRLTFLNELREVPIALRLLLTLTIDLTDDLSVVSVSGLPAANEQTGGG